MQVFSGGDAIFNEMIPETSYAMAKESNGHSDPDFWGRDGGAKIAEKKAKIK